MHYEKCPQCGQETAATITVGNRADKGFPRKYCAATDCDYRERGGVPVNRPENTRDSSRGFQPI